jgi:predicted amidohydrolase YtcJ
MTNNNYDASSQRNSGSVESQPAITIYEAKKIITMNHSNPEGTHVAVREGRILGVGTLDEVAGWGEYTLDKSFKDKVIIPGFVEAHAHLSEGAFWSFPYVGYFDRIGSDGKLWKGCKSISEVVETLKKIESEMTDPNATLAAWGIDPIYFPGERLTKEHLDQVSTTRMISVTHISGHLATANSYLLQQENITKDSPVPGVAKGRDGEPNGELQELPAMSLAKTMFVSVLQQLGSPEAIWRSGQSARNTGVTTITEVGAAQVDEDQLIDTLKEVVNNDEFPARLLVTYSTSMTHLKLEDQVKRGLELAKNNSDKMRFNHVKLNLDGSNQGFTGKISWPGYYKGEDQGQLLVPPEKLKEVVLAFHIAGFKILCHCNGDAAAELFIDAVEYAMNEHPRFDHRHSVEHCQMTTKAQYRRMAALGMGANLFANHIYYWGDQHRDLVFGPERAAGMNACATAKREGVRFALHSDANVTPLGGLYSMWAAVNRLTVSGRVLGAYERISPYDALEAVTLTPAYLLKMDHEIGSLECGKFADFAVLDESPLDVAPVKINNIPVWGTVVGGVKYPAPISQ